MSVASRALSSVLALPSSGWLNESSATCDTLEVFDPLVSLQVLNQSSPLDKGFWAHCAVVVLGASVDLLMNCPHMGETHPFLATFKPAAVFLFSSVSCHVSAKVVFVVTIFSTHSAYDWVFLVVLILHVIGKG